jgi:predicted TIM-barrel fold metal-dependent hydrolase
MGRNGPWLGGRVQGRPSEILRRHVWVNPYHEEDHVELASLIGADHVVFGSDYPHAECNPHPDEWIADVQGKLAPRDLRRILRDNARCLVGLSA